MIDNFNNEYKYLSNFYVAQVFWNGLVWKSSEHAYQAAKTLDRTLQIECCSLSTPGQAKRWGNSAKVKERMREDWAEVKVNIMREILLDKFTRHPYLRELLISTGDQELIEGNYWGDTFWGVCKGVGENWLGKVLMEIREKIK